MKVFVSYAFSGEDSAVVMARIQKLHEQFINLNIDHYINIYAPGYNELVDRGATGGEYLHHALVDLKTSDVVLVLNTSERRSEGMLMEIGAAVALGKKIVLAQHVSSIGRTYIPTVADAVFEWETEKELFEGVNHYFNDSNKSYAVVAE